MTASRILAGAGLLVALCLPAAVVIAIAPKQGAQGGRTAFVISGHVVSVPNEQTWHDLNRNVQGAPFADLLYRGPDLSYRDCNLRDGRSPGPTC